MPRTILVAAQNLGWGPIQYEGTDRANLSPFLGDLAEGEDYRQARSATFHFAAASSNDTANTSTSLLPVYD